jgi:hypothetical protein
MVYNLDGSNEFYANPHVIGMGDRAVFIGAFDLCSLIIANNRASYNHIHSKFQEKRKIKTRVHFLFLEINGGSLSKEVPFHQFGGDLFSYS